jgi:hypothetical protein
MRKIFLILGVIMASALVYAAISKWVFNGESVTTSAAATLDTSDVITLSNSEAVELVTTMIGTDSFKIITYVDGYFKGQWVNALAQDSLINANGANYNTKGLQLRGYGTNVLDGYESIRVRNSTSTGGADDSTAPLKYYQMVIGR